MGYVYKTTRQVTGIGCLQSRIGQTLTGTVGRNEVLQHAHAFLEVGKNRVFDNLGAFGSGFLGLGHQTTHTGKLTDLSGRTTGSGIQHHIYGIETLISFFLTVLISVTLAVLLWANRTASQIAEPYLVMLNSLPKSALAPLLIVWLGSHMHTIILAAVSVAVFGSILTLYTGFTQTDPDLIRLIRSLGGSKKDVLTKVLLPSSIPLLISTMKVNIGLCLVGVIIGEFLCANAGLGYLIIYASQVFKMDLLVMSIVILCLLSTCLYQGIAWIEKRLPF